MSVDRASYAVAAQRPQSDRLRWPMAALVVLVASIAAWMVTLKVAGLLFL
jgi:hypothetical protein